MEETVLMHISKGTSTLVNDRFDFIFWHIPRLIFVGCLKLIDVFFDKLEHETDFVVLPDDFEGDIFCNKPYLLSI